ncbi:Uncharacterised protein [Algoriella xinjiangensis]|uniref:hypothetical protein n=1 Tax=Algoriella xinjiangensis TaxID=684065 RepID=UPI000F642A94|nr:hypothetical protein [Algoriella xinjiangensis]VDH16103.1 Uncharacterised protein [Algoriella xinjiangensis]
MKSTYGTRASICAHFSWTLDYLENQIPWSKVIRMMADLPSYDYDESTDTQTKKGVKITEQNADDILKMFKS